MRSCTVTENLIANPTDKRLWFDADGKTTFVEPNDTVKL